MNLQEKIDKTREELNRLETMQADCQHVFGEPFKEVRIERKFNYRLVGHGSDPSYEPCNPYNVKNYVWCRRCAKCGKLQETTDTEPIIAGTRPVFR